MPVIRLVTFSHLSLLADGGSARVLLDSSVASLSAVSTVFDVHLLQRMDSDHPLDVIGNPRQQERLREAAAENSVNVSLFHHREESASQFPEWMKVDRVRVADERSCASAVREGLEKKSSAGGLQWIHVERPEEGEAGWEAASLEVIAESTVSADDLLIVTALRGSREQRSDRFKSLLPEDQIRVPLWIRTPGMSPGRWAGLSGSFDVLETILMRMGRESDDDGQERPQDLTGLSGDSEPGGDRNIRIESVAGIALRTANFLFVSSAGRSSDEQSALYAKPADVWNVHDVSHEFPDVVEDFRQRLGLAPD